MSDPFTPSPELSAIARRWIETYSARNSNAVLKLFSESDAITYIGSDDGELFAGNELRAMFGTFTEHQNALVPENIESTGYEAGSFGWAYSTLTIYAPDADLRVQFRNTFVFSLEDAVWRIVHIHNSNPKPNIDAMGYASPDLEKLVAAAQADEMDLGRTGIASVMFTDIVDSTALAAATSDGAWSRIATAHVSDIGQQVETAGGTLVKSLGDGTLSTFSSASAAMTAAQTIMAIIAAGATEPHLRLRIGTHTGDVVEAQGDYLGSVVNKAARVAAAAAPDEIRVSDATRAMIGGRNNFSLTDAVSTPLKGLEGEHLIYRLEWQS